MRLLTLAGSLASAYAFSIGEEGIVRGLNAFSGTVIPGVKEAWPDGTIEQLNRISDFGYQTNKVIPKQGAEVIVCFFPIDRFLTPGFKKLFLRSPALFFSPLQMLVDTTMKPEVDKLLHGINEKASVKTLAPLLPCYLEISTVLNTGERRSGIIDYGAGRGCEDKFGLQTVNDPKQRDVFYQIVDADRFESLFITLDFLAQMSLNSVTVTVDGVMTVDTTNIPPSTDGLAFDRLENCGDEKEPCFWTDLKAANGVRTGTITGSYLTGGNVVIAEEKDLGLTDIKTISDGSSDQKVRFSFRLTKPIPSDTKLHFVVSKAQPGTSGKGSLDSPPREHLVGYTMNAPAITNLKQAGNKLTITGLNFFDVPPDHSLIVKLVAPDGTEFEVKPDSATSEEIKVTIPGDAAPAGCWKVRVFVGDSFADSTDHGACLCFFVAPNPVVASAERKDNQIIVKGEDLIDTKSCGGPRLGFQLKKEGGTAIAATVIMFESPKLVILNLPAAVKDGKWTLQVLSNGQPVTGSTPVEIK